MRKTINPISSLVASLASNSALTPSVYRVLVIAADLADSRHTICSSAIAKKLDMTTAGVLINLKRLETFGFLLKVPNRRSIFIFRSQEQWLKPTAKPANKTLAEDSLQAEVKALQELTKELICKLGQ